MRLEAFFYYTNFSINGDKSIAKMIEIGYFLYAQSTG